MRIARSIALSTLVLLSGSLSPAQAGTLTYEVSGRLVSIGSSDAMGLAGSQFHFTLTINSTSAPARSESTNDRALAVYETGRSTLQIRGSAALDGAYRANLERVEVNDTYAGDFCVSFASRFQTPSGSISAPTVCFAPGTAHGAALPQAGLSDETAIAFQAVATSGGMYAVEGGSIEVRGGAR